MRANFKPIERQRQLAPDDCPTCRGRGRIGGRDCQNPRCMGGKLAPPEPVYVPPEPPVIEAGFLGPMRCKQIWATYHKSARSPIDILTVTERLYLAELAEALGSNVAVRGWQNFIFEALSRGDIDRERREWTQDYIDRQEAAKAEENRIGHNNWTGD